MLTTGQWDLASAFDTTSPLARRVAVELLQSLVTGARASGTVLTELEIAQATGVSRTPVREALLQLERAGLVRLMPKKGAVVTLPAGDEARDLLRVRAMFEAEAVDRVSQLGGSSGLADDLRQILIAQQEALENEDLVAFAMGDFAFHARIIAEAGNSVIDATFSGLGPRLACLTYRAVTRDPEAPRRLHEEHSVLAELARTGRSDEFRNALMGHLDGSHGLR